MNTYGYVGGNPVKAIDPLGLTEYCGTCATTDCLLHGGNICPKIPSLVRRTKCEVTQYKTSGQISVNGDLNLYHTALQRWTLTVMVQSCCQSSLAKVNRYGLNLNNLTVFAMSAGPTAGFGYVEEANYNFEPDTTNTPCNCSESEPEWAYDDNPEYGPEAMLEFIRGLQSYEPTPSPYYPTSP